MKIPWCATNVGQLTGGEQQVMGVGEKTGYAKKQPELVESFGDVGKKLD